MLNLISWHLAEHGLIISVTIQNTAKQLFKCCLIVQVFAAEYYQYNKDGVIKSEDAAYVLSFAIMMLHTDLHNPSVRRHMTKKDWLRMNRGQNMTQTTSC